MRSKSAKFLDYTLICFNRSNVKQTANCKDCVTFLRLKIILRSSQKRAFHQPRIRSNHRPHATRPSQKNIFQFKKKTQETRALEFFHGRQISIRIPGTKQKEKPCARRRLFRGFSFSHWPRRTQSADTHLNQFRCRLSRVARPTSFVRDQRGKRDRKANKEER